MDHFNITEVSALHDFDLDTIYRFRVHCRQDDFVSFDKYPNGWKDEIDDQADHIVIMHQTTLAASCRIQILDSITNHVYYPAIMHIVPDDIRNMKMAYFPETMFCLNIAEKDYKI